MGGYFTHSSSQHPYILGFEGIVHVSLGEFIFHITRLMSFGLFFVVVFGIIPPFLCVSFLFVCLSGRFILCFVFCFLIVKKVLMRNV